MGKTTTITFNVKDKSITEFFEINESEIRSCTSINGVSAYHLMRDSILINKEKIGNATQVVFELSDTSQGSRKELLNVYKYSVNAYDSIKYELKLIDFKIHVAKPF